MPHSGFIGCSGVPTDQITVLQAVVNLIQTNVAVLSGSNSCFLSLDPNPEPIECQNVYATVTPLPGDFDEPVYIGSQAALEQAGVVVTVISQMQLDRLDADTEMLIESARGLLTLKRQILRTLNGAMLVDGVGNSILVSPMRPLKSNHPARQASDAGRFSLSFKTDFVWNLT